jgi:hypothetical protein
LRGAGVGVAAGGVCAAAWMESVSRRKAVEKILV